MTMERAWKDHGKIMERSWKDHEHVLYKVVYYSSNNNIFGKVMERAWKGHGKIMERSCVCVISHMFHRVVVRFEIISIFNYRKH